jgi:hypothetical protein
VTGANHHENTRERERERERERGAVTPQVLEVERLGEIET